MDVLCPQCGEPVDNDEFHAYAEEEGTTYLQVVAKFRKAGCSAIGMKCNPEPNVQLAEAASALYGVLGDDMDGASAMFDDQGWV